MSTDATTVSPPITTAAPSPVVPAAPAITPDQLARIERARMDSRRIERAAKVAAFGGWTAAIFAVFSMLGAIIGFSAVSFLLALGLGWVAREELLGSANLRRFDLRAPRRLAINQVIFAGVITMYGVYKIVMALFGASPYDSYIEAGGPVADSIAPIAELTKTVTVAVYGAVILVSWVVQGFTAWYYETRRPILRHFVNGTPEWVIRAIGGTVRA